LLISDFDYHLPKGLIAQHPAEKRDISRLLTFTGGNLEHRHFYEIIDYLKPDDILVFNNSRVIPARLFGSRKKTGARIEIFLISRTEDNEWRALLRPARRVHVGDSIEITPGLETEIIRKSENETGFLIRFSHKLEYEELEQIGVPPLPPYIHRDYKNYTAREKQSDRERYQTVYANEYGSVASPTAGLHFTESLLKKIRDMSVDTVWVTLEVSLGTFRPVKTERIEDHIMHKEKYSVSKEAADKINNRRGRLIAVGTTSTRVLESAANPDGLVVPGTGNTGLFIYPPYKLRTIDALITNFHLPRSTLLMLVAAFIGMDNFKKIYATAIDMNYKFYSYGDAMYLEKKK